MNKILQNLHVHRKIWKNHNKNSLCWAFYCVNDGKKVETRSRQVMKCILCYDNVINILNPRTKKRKGLITYYKTYGIIVLKKHVSAYHSIIAINFRKEINNEITKNCCKTTYKEKTKCLNKCNIYFF
jgi:hypothetical protein